MHGDLEPDERVLENKETKQKPKEETNETTDT